MLRNIINGFFSPNKGKEAKKHKKLSEWLTEAHKYWVAGDIRAALAIYKDAECEYPDAVEVLNGLGVCHGALGNEAVARDLFERAYLLDDSHLPALINRARVYVDARKSADAVPLLRHAWCQAKEGGGDDFLYAIYATMCLNNGDIERAVRFQLKARLSDFDSLRTANGYLFQSAYSDIEEQRLASEHVFWAETLKTLETVQPDSFIDLPKKEGSKIRIGYWSPDLRNHSVRYFLRPLLENHDRTKFEIFLYHDNHAQDAQTELMKGGVDHFHDVYELSDQDLYRKIKSHQLDVLVELAGHTSVNRLPILNYRMAPLQLTALGYPPTTGLANIDGKVLDRFIATEDASSYYSERPMVLPQSFWCFDPMEELPLKVTSPNREKGYITFGCIGNVAKINDRILNCWRKILDRVPDSKLLIRSISFQDEASVTWIQSKLRGAGIDLKQVELLPPIGGADLFKSYSEIDIVLDTFPFNGGTTTCFATYMGVPVISMYGRSLISRMGLSILSNLGVPNWAVPDEESYVEAAVTLAQNGPAMDDFRAQVRSRYANSSLGNGRKYAADFEKACIDWLSSRGRGEKVYQHTVAPIPKVEALRRAYKVLASDNLDAARRILTYIQNHYGRNGSARMLEANICYAESGAEAAIELIRSTLGALDGSDHSAALIMLTQWLLQSNRLEEAREYVGMMRPEEIVDSFDRIQALLFHAAYLSTNLAAQKITGDPAPSLDEKRVKILCPCDTASRFEEMKSNMVKHCVVPAGWSIDYLRCSVSLRHHAYEEIMKSDADYVIVIQSHVDIGNEDFFHRIGETLQSADVVGIAGATSWSQLDWGRSEDGQKAGGYVSLTGRSDLAAEVRYFGVDTERVVRGLAVVDGSLFALNLENIQPGEFDEDLADSAWLMEEDWLFQCGQMGARLVVNRGLGTLHRVMPVEDRSASAASRLHWLDKRGVDPFAPVNQSPLIASVLVKEPIDGCRTLDLITSR